MLIKQKKTLVGSLAKILQDRSNFLLVKFSNTTHQNLETLRKELRKTNAAFKVIKNTLFEKTINGLTKNKPLFKELRKKFFPLKESTALITLDKDWSTGLKAFYNFMQKEKSLTFKLSLLDNNLYSDEETKKIAQLPGREELIGKIIGSLKSPVNIFVNSLKYNSTKLVYILKQKSKEVKS